MLLLFAKSTNDLYTGYIAGVVIALALLGYLVYSLIKPEKF